MGIVDRGEWTIDLGPRNHLSNENNLVVWGLIKGDEILSSYVGIIITISSLFNNKYNGK